MSFKRSRAVRQARSAARELGRDIANLIAPTIVDHRSDHAAFKELAEAAISGVRIGDEFTNIPGDVVAVIQADLRLSFWRRLEEIVGKI